jgi:hypothetical protein
MGRKPWALTSAIVTLMLTVMGAALPARCATAATENTIHITDPIAGTDVASPLRVRGETNFWPFEANLGLHLLDASGRIIGTGHAVVDAPGPPAGGPFEGTLTFMSPATDQEGILQVFEASAKDGSILRIASVRVHLAAQAPPLQHPKTLPLW